MITILLDTPLHRGREKVDKLFIDTPIRTGHLLYAYRAPDQNDVMVRFIESACGMEAGELAKLSIEDYCKVYEVIQPLLAPFERFKTEAK